MERMDWLCGQERACRFNLLVRECELNGHTAQTQFATYNAGACGFVSSQRVSCHQISSNS